MADAVVDALVIGAGPAGSAAARAVALAGWRVVMLERDVCPGQRTVCGGGLEEADAHAMSLPDALIQQLVTRRRHYFPWGLSELNTPHVVTRRCELDGWLAGRALAAGTELLTRTRARRVTRLNGQGGQDGPLAVLATCPGERGERQVTYRARLVVFADGPHTLAPASGNLGFVCRPSNAAVGLIYELDWPGAPWEHYEVHFGAPFSPWGYAWIFPQRDRLNVGLTVLPSRAASRDIEVRLQHFVASRPELRGLQIARRAAGHIPVAPARRVYDHAMLAAGDAAGAVEALTGAGIAGALLSGRLAGEVACEALAAGDCSARFLSRYQQRWQATARYRSMRVQAAITRALLPFSRLDSNLYAKVMQILFLGGELSRSQKLRLLAHARSTRREMTWTRMDAENLDCP